MRRLIIGSSWILLVVAAVVGCSTSSESPGSEAAVPGPAGNPFQVEIQAPEKAAVGAQATTKVVVTPRNGFKINVDYPAKLVLGDLPAGTKVAASTVTKGQMQVEKARLVVPVRFTSEAPGEKQFSGELRFSVCNPQTCQMPREQVSWTTVVEAADQ